MLLQLEHCLEMFLSTIAMEGLLQMRRNEKNFHNSHYKENPHINFSTLGP